MIGSRRAVVAWLYTGCVLIALLVTVGGITRLTGSGLSITEWDVLMGALPPLDAHAWQELWQKYQATPQYQQVNTHFTLDQFKSIFWWEYIHRLLARKDELFSAAVIIVIAGMDGALASVIGGLVRAPVIAVPTSVGYGAAFGGIAPLLAMLNSCAAGVTVVNIDNGFGAAMAASRINHW